MTQHGRARDRDAGRCAARVEIAHARLLVAEHDAGAGRHDRRRADQAVAGGHGRRQDGRGERRAARPRQAAEPARARQGREGADGRRRSAKAKAAKEAAEVSAVKASEANRAISGAARGRAGACRRPRPERGRRQGRRAGQDARSCREGQGGAERRRGEGRGSRRRPLTRGSRASRLPRRRKRSPPRRRPGMPRRRATSRRPPRRAGERATEPISVFVSKKTGRVQIRQAWRTIHDAPATFRDADAPLGTHVYVATEMVEDGKAMRWLSVTLPQPAPRAETRAARAPRRPAPGSRARRRQPRPAARDRDRRARPHRHHRGDPEIHRRQALGRRLAHRLRARRQRRSGKVYRLHRAAAVTSPCVLRDKRRRLGYNAAPMRLITTTDELAELCKRLAQHDFVAVDTGIHTRADLLAAACASSSSPARRTRRSSIPCDPGISLEPFFDLMADEARGRRCSTRRARTWRSSGTRRASSRIRSSTPRSPPWCAASARSVSYVNLVKQITGHDLDKTSRFTDWSRRPLSQQQLTYALGDVTHLRDVYRRLKAELEKDGPRELARRGDGEAHRSRAPTRPTRRRPGAASSCGSRTARGWRC